MKFIKKETCNTDFIHIEELCCMAESLYSEKYIIGGSKEYACVLVYSDKYHYVLMYDPDLNERIPVKRIKVLR